MARARNKTEANNVETAAEVETVDAVVADVTETDAELAELVAIEAALNGDGDADVTIDDANFGEDEEALNAAIAADEAKETAYEDQESTIDVADDGDVDAAATASKITKGGSGSKGSLSSKARDLDTFVDTVVTILGNDAVLDSEVGQIEEADLRSLMGTASQIKVREKVLNMLQNAVSGTTLSVYTKIAMKLMVEAAQDGCKPVTLADIKKAYEDSGYKKGTVDAQAGQMMKLFPVMGVAKTGTVKGLLEPNPNSVMLNVSAAA